MKKWLAWTVLGVFCAAMLAGCATAPKAERRGLTYRVEANSLILDNKIRVLETSAKKVNGLLEVKVRGSNVGAKGVTFDYRFVWLDKDGVVTEVPTSAWKMITVPAKEKVLMQGKAPSADAVKFLISVRPGA